MQAEGVLIVKKYNVALIGTGFMGKAHALAWRNVQAVAGDAPLTAAMLKEMGQLRNIFRETLRLYPPVPMMVRENLAEEDFRGRTVNPGGQIVLSPWHLHRHERLWDAPDAFDPARFETENGKACLREAYIPFSTGARVCPGAGFAMAEGPLILAMILQAFEISTVTERPAVPVAHLTVRAKDGIWLRLTLRKAL